jgi:hypothetical protein
MNTFKKYCPNVWVANCEEKHEKGDIITLETKYGKEVECEVYNLLAESNDRFYYSIVRLEDQTYAERKAEKWNNASNRSIEKSNERYEAAQEGSDFLKLAEPIKIGHHSEKRHRALYERNAKRMDKCIEFHNKAEEQRRKAEYWESKKNDINLSMPDSIDYYTYKLEKATEYHKGLKDGSIPKQHSYSVQYANKDVKELKKKVEIANKLWGKEV